jgi:hypothetical protein
MTERCLGEGDELFEQHAAVQRDCANHAEELSRLIEMHERIGVMLAKEQRRFAAYFPQQQQQQPPSQTRAQAAARLVRDDAPREIAHAAQK